MSNFSNSTERGLPLSKLLFCHHKYLRLSESDTDVESCWGLIQCTKNLSSNMA